VLDVPPSRIGVGLGFFLERTLADAPFVIAFGVRRLGRKAPETLFFLGSKTGQRSAIN